VFSVFTQSHSASDSALAVALFLSVTVDENLHVPSIIFGVKTLLFFSIVSNFTLKQRLACSGEGRRLAKSSELRKSCVVHVNLRCLCQKAKLTG